MPGFDVGMLCSKNESSKVPSTAVNIFLAEKISKQYEEAQNKVRFVISMPHNPFINCFSGNIDELRLNG